MLIMRACENESVCAVLWYNLAFSGGYIYWVFRRSPPVLRCLLMDVDLISFIVLFFLFVLLGHWGCVPSEIHTMSNKIEQSNLNLKQLVFCEQFFENSPVANGSLLFVILYELVLLALSCKLMHSFRT